MWFITSSGSLSALTRQLFMHMCLVLKYLFFYSAYNSFQLILSFKDIYFCIFYYRPAIFGSSYLDLDFSGFFSVVTQLWFLCVLNQNQQKGQTSKHNTNIKLYELHKSIKYRLHTHYQYTYP